MPNFSMFAGDTKVLEIVVVDESNVVVDLTATVIRWQLAKQVTDSPIISKSIGSGIEVVSAPGGRFNVSLAPADTLNLSGTYYFESELDKAGVISTVLTGNADIKPALIDPGSLRMSRRKPAKAV